MSGNDCIGTIASVASTAPSASDSLSGDTVAEPNSQSNDATTRSARTTPLARKVHSVSGTDAYKTPEINHKLKDCIFQEDRRLATHDVASTTEELHDLKLHADILDIFRSPLRKFLARLAAWSQHDSMGPDRAGRSRDVSSPFSLLHVYGGEAYRMYWEASIRHLTGVGPEFGTLPPFRRPADIDVMIPLRESQTWFDAPFQAASQALVSAFHAIFRQPELTRELRACATLAAQRNGILSLVGPFINFRSSPYHYCVDPATGASVFDDTKMFHTAVVTLHGYHASTGVPTSPITLLEMQLKPERACCVATAELACCVLSPARGATVACIAGPVDAAKRERMLRPPPPLAGPSTVGGGLLPPTVGHGAHSLTLQILSVLQMLQGAEKVLGNRHNSKHSKAKTDVNRFTWLKDVAWVDVFVPATAMEGVAAAEAGAAWAFSAAPREQQRRQALRTLAQPNTPASCASAGGGGSGACRQTEDDGRTCRFSHGVTGLEEVKKKKKNQRRRRRRKANATEQVSGNNGDDEDGGDVR
jgi:hypothetical protein